MSSRRPDAPRRPTVLVLGATGKVGTVVADHLDEFGTLQVIRGSRSAGTSGAPGCARVDVDDVVQFRGVLRELDPAVVVFCVEPADVSSHRSCLEAGVSVVDVCATPEQLARIEMLEAVATRTGASCVLSVGVAPGLTNYLAREVSHDLGGADSIELTVVLGAAEAHGLDAVRWTLESLSRAGSRLSPAGVLIPERGSRRTYPMPFSDQETLPRTLGVPTVTTRMCLDSRLVSAALFGLAQSRVGRRVLGTPSALKFISASSGRIPLGSDEFIVVADASKDARHRRRWIRGQGQSTTTGLVAVEAATCVLAGAAPPGIRHLEEIPDLVARVPLLVKHGLLFSDAR